MQVLITETNKQSALCHRVEPALLELLWSQDSLHSIASDRLAIRFGAGPSRQSLPARTLPDLSVPWVPGAGLGC